MHIDELLKGICHRGWVIKTSQADWMQFDSNKTLKT